MRNTWVICREVWDNSLKGELIPDVNRFGGNIGHSKLGTVTGLALHDEPAAYQLVGEVTAHQG